MKPVNQTNKWMTLTFPFLFNVGASLTHYEMKGWTIHTVTPGFGGLFVAMYMPIPYWHAKAMEEKALEEIGNV